MGGGGGGVLRHSAVQTDFEFEISGPLMYTLQVFLNYQNGNILFAVIPLGSNSLIKKFLWNGDSALPHQTYRPRHRNTF